MFLILFNMAVNSPGKIIQTMKQVEEKSNIFSLSNY